MKGYFYFCPDFTQHDWNLLVKERIINSMPSLPCMQRLMPLGHLDIFCIHVDIYILPRSTMPFTKQHRQVSLLDVFTIHDVVFPWEQKSKAGNGSITKSWTVEEPSDSLFMPVQNLAHLAHDWDSDPAATINADWDIPLGLLTCMEGSDSQQQVKLFLM